jgi:hypothetical protein
MKASLGRATGLALVCAMCLGIFASSAQAQEHGSAVSEVFKSAVRDPLVYAPAVVKYGSMRLDWISSQTFFQHGFVERNARYTVSGRSGDTAISYDAGNRKIAVDSLKVLAQSMSANVAERGIERMLSPRFVNHQKLLRVAGQAGRIATASYLMYLSSMPHFQQWRQNERLARQLGYK